MEQKDSFFQALKNTISLATAKEKGVSAVLSVLTLFTVLGILTPEWYAQMPGYDELVCGAATWSAYNKQADMALVHCVIFLIPLLYLFFVLFFSAWKQIFPHTGRNAALFFLGGYIGSCVSALLQRQAGWHFLVIWLGLFAGYVLLAFRTRRKADVSLEVLFGNVVLSGLFSYFAMISLLLAANAFTRKAGVIWTKASLAVGAASAVFYLIQCLFAGGEKKAEGWLAEITQWILPVAWIGCWKFRYCMEETGTEVVLFHSGRWKIFCLAAVLILWGILLLQRRRKRGEIALSTFIMTAILRIFTMPQGTLNIDYFHNGELSMPMQQFMSYGKLPYLDIVPIHGMCDYFYGFLNYLFFDGTYFSLNAAKLVGELAMAVLFAVILYELSENKMQGFLLTCLFIPFFVRTAGMRYVFVFLLFFFLFSKKAEEGSVSLYGWTLLSMLAIAWNAAIGGAAALGTLPVVCFRLVRDLKKRRRETEKRQKWNRPVIAAWSALVMAGILFLPAFLQIVEYLRENTGTTLYVNGTGMFQETADVASYLVPGLVNEQGVFFLVAFGFIVPVLICLCYAFGKEKTQAALLALAQVLSMGILASYAFVRFDNGERATALGVFFLILVVFAVLGRQVELGSNKAVWLYTSCIGLAVLLTDDVPLPSARTLYMESEVPASVETTIMGQEVSDPVVYVSGDSVSMPNLGTGFIQGNTLQSLVNVNTVLQTELVNPGEEGRQESQGEQTKWQEQGTCLDLTNAVANTVIFDLPGMLPYTSAYNISNEIMQDKAIEMLSGNLPDLILVSPEICFDEAPFSVRSRKLYRYLMQQGYTPYKYENVIYLLRADSKLEGAAIDEEAFAALMHKEYMDYLPAVWGESVSTDLQNRFGQEAWQKVDADMQIRRTEEGFAVVFDRPVNGGEIDFIAIHSPALGRGTENGSQKKSSGAKESSGALTEDKGNKKDFSSMITMRFSSSISREQEVEMKFYTWGEYYLIPVGTSPYFTQESEIKELLFEVEGGLLTEDDDKLTEQTEIQLLKE